MITKDDIDFNGIDVIVGITRWCNMECNHCLRGDKQRRRTKKIYLDSLFRNFSDSYFTTFSVTGGEPTLALDLIEECLYSAKSYGVDIGNFWMSSNGTCSSNKFIDILQKWYDYCTANDFKTLQISTDQYHFNDKYKIYEIQEKVETYLGSDVYLTTSFSGEGLIAEGYAEGYGTREPVRISLLSDGRIDGTFYMNEKGDVFSSCDISYETQDMKNPKYYICNILDDDVKQKFCDFFNRFPSLVEEKMEIEYE